jgi:hypothetical protein
MQEGHLSLSHTPESKVPVIFYQLWQEPNTKEQDIAINHSSSYLQLSKV